MSVSSTLLAHYSRRSPPPHLSPPERSGNPPNLRLQQADVPQTTDNLDIPNIHLRQGRPANNFDTSDAAPSDHVP